MLTSVSFLLVFLFGLNFKKRKNTVEAKFVPVIRWNLVPKVLSLTLSRLAPEPPVTVAVLCFYASPATASHVAVGGLGFRQRWRVPRSPGATQPAAPCLVPAAVAVASGPAQPAEASVRPAVRSRWTAREKRKKNRTCMFRRISTIFILSLAPPPFLYALTAPRSSQNRASKL